MTRAPTVLGPALITAAQQRGMVDGSILTVPASAVYPDAAKRARVGAWWWAREPFLEFVSKKGMFLGLARGVGPLATRNKGLNLPSRSSGRQILFDYRSVQYTGEHLGRADSWTSLEITAVQREAAGWLCRVHMQNIDALIASRRAA